MSPLIEDLQAFEDKVDALYASCTTTEFNKAIEDLLKARAEIADAHSQLAEHPTVYRDDFVKPSWEERHLLKNDLSEAWDVWTPFDHRDVLEQITMRAGDPPLGELLRKSHFVEKEIPRLRTQLLDILHVAYETSDYGFLEARSIDAEAVSFVRGKADSPVPHLQFAHVIQDVRRSFETLNDLKEIAFRSRTYLERQQRIKGGAVSRTKPQGNRVFIGHGRSPAWRELAMYLRDRHGVEYDEFNREAAAGVGNTERLSEMLDNAAFALLVMTGEDETANHKLQARLNVVHEVGLFQGRLGFRKAIILLEQGCEEFSNIHGLTHISFEPDKIKGAFAEVVDTLRREKVVP